MDLEMAGNVTTAATHPSNETEPWISTEFETASGVVLTVLTVFGIIENACVVGMFYRFRREYSSRTAHLLISLAVSDGLMALIGGTMYSISSFMHRWPFTYQGCVFYGVVMYATGCTDIAHLMVIALDRLMAVTSPIRYMAWGKKTSISAVAIAFCWIFGSIWAILPLTGLQRYTHEGRTSCSIDWQSKVPAHKAYNVLIFVGSFLIPLAAILCTYIIIYITVKTSNKKFAGNIDAATKKKRDTEIQLALNLSMVVVVYITAWTPYAIVSMWGAFGDASVIPVSAQGLPAVLAKCSMMLNPLVYVASNKSHRKSMRAFLGIGGTNQVTPPTNEETSNTQGGVTSVTQNVVAVGISTIAGKTLGGARELLPNRPQTGKKIRSVQSTSLVISDVSATGMTSAR